MPCLTLWPAPECGWNGKCNDGAQNGTSFCECDVENGWSHSLEFNYFVNEDDLSSSLCSYNKKIVDILYICCIVICLATSVLHLLSIDRISQLKRGSPFLAFSILCIALSVYKITDENALFGVDFPFTFFSVWCAVLIQTQGYVFLTKYFAYMIKKVDSFQNDIETFYISASMARTIYSVLIITSAVSLQFCWISTFVGDRKVSKRLVQVALYFQVLRVAYQVVYFYRALSELSKDMKRIVSLEDCQSNDSLYFKHTNKAFVDWVRRRIPKIIRMRNRMTGFALIEFLMWMFSASFDFFLLSFTYVMPLMILLMFLYTFAVLLGKTQLNIVIKNDYIPFNENTTLSKTLDVSTTDFLEETVVETSRPSVIEDKL